MVVIDIIIISEIDGLNFLRLVVFVEKGLEYLLGEVIVLDVIFKGIELIIFFKFYVILGYGIEVVIED